MIVSRADLEAFRFNRMHHMRKGVKHLLKGEFGDGWRYYRARNGIHWFDRRFDMPYWEGQHIKGKRLLVMYEQAIGEQIYFASVIPDLVEMGAHVILEVDERLVSIMQRSFPGVEVIPYEFPVNEACYTADYQVFAGNAMACVRQCWEQFPDKKGYLTADTTIASTLPKFDIGLSWQSKAQHYAKSKNIDIVLFYPLISNTKKSVISVQYGQFDDIMVPRLDLDITHNLENCAALLTNCSKVISVSNATAHLAGALGVETHVLVPNTIGRHFYWYPERETVPNYPSAAAYLQMPAKNWEPLVEYITKKVLDN
jgi:hypothetical protein